MQGKSNVHTLMMEWDEELVMSDLRMSVSICKTQSSLA